MKFVSKLNQSSQSPPLTNVMQNIYVYIAFKM